MSPGLFYQSPCYVSKHWSCKDPCCLWEGQRALFWFHQKYFNLWSEDELRSCRFGMTWGWVIKDRIFIFGWNLFNLWDLFVWFDSGTFLAFLYCTLCFIRFIFIWPVVRLFVISHNITRQWINSSSTIHWFSLCVSPHTQCQINHRSFPSACVCSQREVCVCVCVCVYALLHIPRPLCPLFPPRPSLDKQCPFYGSVAVSLHAWAQRRVFMCLMGHNSTISTVCLLFQSLSLFPQSPLFGT